MPFTKGFGSSSPNPAHVWRHLRLLAQAGQGCSCRKPARVGGASLPGAQSDRRAVFCDGARAIDVALARI